MTSTAYCLYCDAVSLNTLPESNKQITFFGCPQCHRQFAQSPGKTLTERWGGVLSLVLYGVLFEKKPQAGADRIAAMFCARQNREKLAWIESEIRRELVSPKQNVRDILDHHASEEDLREFLALVADKLHESLQEHDDAS